MISKNKSIFLIVAIAFIIRFTLFLIVLEHPERTHLHLDTGSYWVPAVNLIEGHGFSRKNEPPFIPDAYRTPGYPFFMAVVFSIFGRKPVIIAFIQVVIGTMSALLTYLLGLKLISRPSSHKGTLCFALSLGPAIYTVFIMTETLFTFVFLSSIYALTLYNDSLKKRWVITGGLLMGISILIRPVTLFFPFAALFMIWAGRPDSRRRFISGGLLFLFAAVLTVAPWVMRNYRKTGIPAVSTVGHYNLLFFNACSLLAELNGVSQAKTRAVLKSELKRKLYERGWKGEEALRVKLCRKWGSEIILSAPLKYLLVHLENDLVVFLPNVTIFSELLGITRGEKGTTSVLKAQGLFAAVKRYFGDKIWFLYIVSPYIIFLGVIYLSALLGVIIQALRKQWYSITFLLLPAIYLTMLPGAAVPRFRVPAMPFICLFAGVGLTVIFNNFMTYWKMRCGKVREKGRNKEHALTIL